MGPDLQMRNGMSSFRTTMTSEGIPNTARIIMRKNKEFLHE